mmetsp:Transcript_77914/g.140600  ORF Transcript_77914/g.140600 Transcript_77914/m.140600 type:complete len:81 (-) Transcript_77914:752-994(-)
MGPTGLCSQAPQQKSPGFVAAMSQPDRLHFEADAGAVGTAAAAGAAAAAVAAAVSASALTAAAADPTGADGTSALHIARM